MAAMILASHEDVEAFVDLFYGAEGNPEGLDILLEMAKRMKLACKADWTIFRTCWNWLEFLCDGNSIVPEERSEPCSYCGCTEWYYRERDGWDRCVVCHGC